MQPSRAEQRHALRAQRARLSPQEQSAAAQRLLRQIRTLREYRTSDRVACYYPNDGEIDPRPIMEHLWSAGKHCYLPVLTRWRPHLTFGEVLPGTPLIPNRLRIPEPICDELLTAQDLDLILMPLVGFDRRGNRLGMGGGFYDRTLAFLRHRRHWKKPRLFGLAHEFQHLDALPAEPWDVPVQGIVTDRAFYPVANP